ncbi:MAG: dienelactone hydrolase family protein [Kofleriaceae bacterium]
MNKLILAIALSACSHHASKTCGAPTTAQTPAGVKTLHFPAADGVTITADLYAPHAADAPMIVLFHQAGYSRGEYRTIAPQLNQLGFNAMAIDARSGEAVAGVGNDTAASACAAGKGTTYLDAIADLKAAVAEARQRTTGKLIIWGSSYSSSLVLVLGEELHADAVLSFSPGEYFDDLGKSKTWVAESAKALTMPVYITSAKSEVPDWQPIAAGIAHVTKFIPPTDGHHGSSVLWPTQPDSAGYWASVTTFLKTLQ